MSTTNSERLKAMAFKTPSCGEMLLVDYGDALAVVAELTERIDKLTAERDRYRNFGDEFVWGENNPDLYESELTRLTTENAALQTVAFQAQEMAKEIAGNHNATIATLNAERDKYNTELRRVVACNVTGDAALARVQQENAALQADLEASYGDHCRWCREEEPVERLPDGYYWQHPGHTASLGAKLCNASAGRERQFQRTQEKVPVSPVSK